MTEPIKINCPECGEEMMDAEFDIPRPQSSESMYLFCSQCDLFITTSKDRTDAHLSRGRVMPQLICRGSVDELYRKYKLKAFL